MARPAAHRNVVVAGSLALAVLAAGAACKSNDVTQDSTANYVSQVVGSGGGPVLGPPSTGIVLQVPQGALASDTTISIGILDPSADPPPPAGYAYDGPVYSFEPHGLAFQHPVGVTIPNATSTNTFHATCPSSTPHATSTGCTWDASPVSDVVNGSFQASSFSLYALVHRIDDGGPPVDSSHDADTGVDAAPACSISGTTYASGAPNPTNDCQSCQPNANASGWTSVPDGTTCSQSPNGVCNAGLCARAWNWMGGSKQVGQAGVYGTKGTPAPTNAPGARSFAATWKDAAGNAWMFGGDGYDSAGTAGGLSDLWEYSAGQWVWRGGTNLANQVGVYGTKGNPSPNNIPGARSMAAICTDPSGNVYMFGGSGLDSSTGGLLSDLWKYDTNGQWTWLSGPNVGMPAATYGTKGQFNVNNKPGARKEAACWIDVNGNLWLFGGLGYSSTTNGVLNDFWQFSMSMSQWAWMSGASTPSPAGVYSGTPYPGGRWGSPIWSAGSGIYYMFGGNGVDGFQNGGYLGDYWKFAVATPGQFQFVNGYSTANPPAAYGPDAGTNFPGGRIDAESWTDSKGTQWLYGGVTKGAVSDPCVSDLWTVDHSGNWTWVAGDSTNNVAPVYGTIGSPALTNTPGCRSGAATWSDGAGKIWLFGGQNAWTREARGDLWSY
jgi:hypothetical protein